MNTIITVCALAAIMALWVILSLLGQWLQRRRDDITTFAALADKINRPPDMPHHHSHQPHHHGRRHAR